MTVGQYSIFKHYIYDKHKFILMGDYYQLPPFEPEQEDSLPSGVSLLKNPTKDLSMFFQFKCNDIKLFTNMRTQNKELNDYISGIRSRVSGKEIQLTNNWKMDYDYIRMNKFREYIVICHKNKDVDKYNENIRKELNIGKELDEVEIGDKIVISQYYKCLTKDGLPYRLLNGDRGTISFYEPITLKFRANITRPDSEVIDFNFYKIEVNNHFIIYKIKYDEYITFKKYIEKQVKLVMKKYPIVNVENIEDNKNKRIELFRELKSIRETHCFYNFGFASTVHKAQGSSYDVVMVLNDTNFYFRNKNKYTAVSRVVNELKIFS